jgi:hypothetical protein
MWRKLLNLTRVKRSEVEADQAPVRRVIRLTPTPTGRAVLATGKLETCEDAGWQCAILTLHVQLSDGTALTVFLNHEPAGSTLVAGCAAEWTLGVTETDELPNGLAAVSGIRTVMVTTPDGVAVLTGIVQKA